jgi:hypothetical protein
MRKQEGHDGVAEATPIPWRASSPSKIQLGISAVPDGTRRLSRGLTHRSAALHGGLTFEAPSPYAARKPAIGCRRFVAADAVHISHGQHSGQASPWVPGCHAGRPPAGESVVERRDMDSYLSLAGMPAHKVLYRSGGFARFHLEQEVRGVKHDHGRVRPDGLDFGKARLRH